MNLLARRFSRHGSKTLRTAMHNVLRLSTADEHYPPKPDPNCQQVGPCPPPPPTGLTCPDPPPCSSVPPCPSRICPPVSDPNNPCNFVPPPPDPEYPDLTKLKKTQCKFQEEDDIPVYLKNGSFDAYLFHTTAILTVIGMIMSFYAFYRLANR